MQKGYDLHPIRANITLSTLLGFNLLVAIRANCKETTQFSYFVILNITKYSLLSEIKPYV